MEIDLHGYHPNEIVGDGVLHKILEQAWEMGQRRLCFIHGHGRNRGISPGFVNTNTGYFGLRIRSALRHATELRPWIKVSTLNRSHPGATSIDLKHNPAPTRTELERLCP
jgi:creatinine amidohydrolase/Fe(II)-dependent formamide hydrolase-like protein